MTRRTFLLLVAVAVALTGCRVDVHTDVAVREDGSGEVAVTVTTDAEVVRAAPTLADDLSLDDARAAGWSVDGPRMAPDGGLTVVVRKPFRTVEEAAVVLAELSGPQGPFQALGLSQDRSFATLRTAFTGAGGVQGGLAAFSDNELVAALGGKQPFAAAVGDRPLGDVLGITLTLSMPGSVTHSASAAQLADDGSSASYQVPVDGSTVDLATTAELRDEDALAARRRQRLAVGGLLLWLAAVVGAATWWYLTRRPSGGGRGPNGPDEPGDPDEPQLPPPARRARPAPPAPEPEAEAVEPAPAGRPFDPGLAPDRRLGL